MKSKITSIALSIVVAFSLWLYVITNVSQEDDWTFHNVPVVMEGESVLNERGLMITSQSVEDIDVRLSGNRTDLGKVSSSNLTVKADLNRITEVGERIALPLSVTFPPDVSASALAVEERSPGYCYVDVEERHTKDVPVEIKWTGSAPAGFMSDRENRMLDNDIVSIAGPASVVDVIEKAVIEVDLSEQRESIANSYRYTLCDAQDNPVDAEMIVTNVEEIRLEVKILRVKEMPLQLDVTYGGGTNQENTEILIEPASIRLSGGEAVLDELGDVLVLGKLNLAEITKPQTKTYTITLPEGVTNLSGIAEVSVTIRFTGLSIREFYLDNNRIQVLNVPEGMDVEIINERLNLILRGETADISKLEEEDISVSVDFTGAEEGTFTFKATVTCAEPYGDIGALEPCTVSATVSKK